MGHLPYIIQHNLPLLLPHQTLLPKKVKKQKTMNEGGGLGAKWSVKEDRQLVESWINVSTNPITGADHKKSRFWNKVEILYNRYAPERAIKRTGKICNARWNWASPLVSKWCGSVAEAYRINPSGANEDTIMQLGHESYQTKVGKTLVSCIDGSY